MAEMVARVYIRSFSLRSFSSPELLYISLQNDGKDIVKKKHNKVVPEDHLCIAQMVCMCTTSLLLWEILNLLCPGFTADSNLHHKPLWHFQEVLDLLSGSPQLIYADAVEMSGVFGHWVTQGCYHIVVSAGCWTCRNPTWMLRRSSESPFLPDKICGQKRACPIKPRRVGLALICLLDVCKMQRDQAEDEWCGSLKPHFAVSNVSILMLPFILDVCQN